MHGKHLIPTATPRCNLRFKAVLVMCFTVAVQVSAMDEVLEGPRRGEVQNFRDRESANGADVSGKQTSLHRERRSVNKNASSLSAVEKRLQAMEERHNKSTRLMEKRFDDMEKRFIKRLDALLHAPPRSSDSSLLAYLLVRDGRYNGVPRMGPPGPPGKPGPKGDQGAAGKTGDKGDKGKDGKSGVKYVRWGKTTCPRDADIVYKGIMGGEHYNHPGGGVNYLCLPNNPKYDKYKSGWQSSGYMYGTEYEVGQYNGDPFKRGFQDHDAVCVVCFVKSRGSMLMMPARNDCPSGWTEEYHGYLMTEYYNHKKSRDFICVDKDPEYVSGSGAGKNGALLYPVQSACGSLPCGPYVKERELTCAVCTK